MQNVTIKWIESVLNYRLVLGNPGYVSLFARLLFSLKGFVVFLSPVHSCWDSILKLSTVVSFPHPSSLSFAVSMPYDSV
jgi:hypothetical protein